MKLATSLENLQHAFKSKNFRFVRLHQAKETQDITQHIPQTPSASSQGVSWNDLNGEFWMKIVMVSAWVSVLSWPINRNDWAPKDRRKNLTSKAITLFKLDQD
ncbi:hypothetical protein ES288_A03G025200v1 [Gossypium darwinii]|uniref:Uncharacterized protein n=2 Tax=Gossypium TaxID=3633 RepID=A0A5D2R245_GOSTO|nr:hypothetical protein ES288_A03G025200v1 [Gossypium darwinii]TYI34666.1 hypothetical protein ES332_A03G024800v1 [Gossypium tomentosum]